MSYELPEELCWIEMRLMKSTKYHPEPEQIANYQSCENNLGFIKETYEGVVEELTEAIK